jgi:hydrogenase/urease accessory protein HupE
VIVRWILLWLFAIGITADARADDLRPGYLEIRETTSPTKGAEERHYYAINWKAPIKPGLATGVIPTFPRDCNATAPQRIVDADALLARWSIDCQKPLAGRKIGLSGIENTSADALLRYQSASGTTQTERITPSNPDARIAEKPDRWQVARTYFVTGVAHILMGYDHLLFVLCLVLLLSGAWRVAATVTAFTVAHSLTLIATTLDLIRLPGPPVEALIALSIVFLAVEIVKRKPGEQRLSERIPWVVAFLFGLLHGFGFAGALAEIGLPQGEVPMALLTFNLGVEAGQLVIVGVAMAVLAIIRRAGDAIARKAQTISAYAIGAVAAMWLLERVFGT